MGGAASAAGAGLGVATAIGGIYAGNKAASAQRGAANSAKNSLSAAQADATGRLDPYANYGEQALVPLSALLYGKNYDTETNQFTGDVSQADRMNSFQQSPGYQYQLDQGLKAVERRNAATGTLLGGNTLRELQETGQGLANQDYYNYINTLTGQAGIGQNAATNQANIVAGIGSQLAGYNYAGGMGNAQKYANLSNFLFGVSGQGFGAAMGQGSGSGGGGGGGGGGSSGGLVPAGGGMYNTSFFNNAGNAASSNSWSLK